MSRDTQEPRAEATPQRDAQGRFVKGNAGGPGNPFARKCAALRQALLDSVTAEDIQDIAILLKFQAKAGDLAAIKLLFNYAMGKPPEAPDPDRLDAEEWQLLKVTSQTDLTDLTTVPFGMPLELGLIVARAATLARRITLGQQMADKLLEPERQAAAAAAQEGCVAPTPEPARPDGDQRQRGRPKAQKDARPVPQRRTTGAQPGERNPLLDELGRVTNDGEFRALVDEELARLRPSANGRTGQAPPSANGRTGQAPPSANGVNGHGHP